MRYRHARAGVIYQRHVFTRSVEARHLCRFFARIAVKVLKSATMNTAFHRHEYAASVPNVVTIVRCTSIHRRRHFVCRLPPRCRPSLVDTPPCVLPAGVRCMTDASRGRAAVCAARRKSRATRALYACDIAATQPPFVAVIAPGGTVAFTPDQGAGAFSLRSCLVCSFSAACRCLSDWQQSGCLPDAELQCEAATFVFFARQER